MDNTEGMGSMVFIFGIIIVGIWLALRDTERKDKQKVEQEFIRQQQEQAAIHYQQEQKTRDARFKNEFGDAPYDYNDIALSEKVLEYAGSQKDIEKVKGLASLLGGLKQTTAQAAAQATAAELKKQLEANKQNMQQLPPAKRQQPIIEQSRYYEPPPRRQRYYDDDEDHNQNPNGQRRGYSQY
jgi:hypothetical protein